MQLIEANAVNSSGCYKLPVRLHDNALVMKFDTGANKTVISAELIFGELTDEQRTNINKLCSNYCAHEVFTSASGHSFIAYPFFVANATIGKTEIPRLNCYLIVDKLFDDRKVALLGKDFIDYCSFSHEFCGDIIIESFDELKYDIRNNETTTANVSVNEIINLIQ